MLLPDVFATETRSFKALLTILALMAHLRDVDSLEVLESSVLPTELSRADNARSFAGGTADSDEGLELRRGEVSQVRNFA